VKITNLKVPDGATPASTMVGSQTLQDAPVSDGNRVAGSAAGAAPNGEIGGITERQNLEIAMLKARIQHLELVVETARSLMGANQERLLRRLHEVPRELAVLGAQLRRIDPHAVW
jgi:hypothetical protein